MKAKQTCSSSRFASEILLEKYEEEKTYSFHLNVNEDGPGIQWLHFSAKVFIQLEGQLAVQSTMHEIIRGLLSC